MKSIASISKWLMFVSISVIVLAGGVGAQDEKTFDFSEGVDPYFTAVQLNGGSTSVTEDGLSITSGQTAAAFVRTTDPLPEMYTIEAVIENTQQYNFEILDDTWSGQAGDYSMHGPHLKVLIGADNFGPAAMRNNILYASPTSWIPGSMNWAGTWDGTAWRTMGTAWLSPEMNVGELYRLGIQKTADEYILYIKTLDGTTLAEAPVPIDEVNNGTSRDFWAFGDIHTDSLYGVNTRIVSATVSQPITQVYIDIKPGSCPNSLNLKDKGVLTVAALGTENFDVTTIDPTTISLSHEGIGSTSPTRWSYEDVATPFMGSACDCNDLNGDGYTDLTLKFDVQTLITALGLTDFAGNTIPINLTGSLKEEDGGSAIEGADCLKIIGSSKQPPMLFDEGNTRHVMLDIVLGNVMGYYKQQLQFNPSQPDIVEAIRRLESGITVTNADQFERKIIGTWSLVYRGTGTLIRDNMEIKLSFEAQDDSDEYRSCVSSGGTVETNMCCKSVSDFPNTCLIGACGCSPTGSKETKVCDCGPERCFNGTACVAI